MGGKVVLEYHRVLTTDYPGTLWLWLWLWRKLYKWSRWTSVYNTTWWRGVVINIQDVIIYFIHWCESCALPCAFYFFSFFTCLMFEWKCEKVFVTFIIYWLLYVLCVLCTQTYNIFNRWEPLIAPICTMIRSSAYHCCVCVCVPVLHTLQQRIVISMFFF